MSKVKINKWLRNFFVAAGLMGLVAAIMLLRGYLEVRTAEKALDRAVARADLDLPNWRLRDLIASPSRLPKEENSAEILHNLAEKHKNLLPNTDFLDTLHQTPFFQDLPDIEIERINKASIQEADLLSALKSLSDRTQGQIDISIDANVRVVTSNLYASQSFARLLLAEALRLAHEGKIDEALDTLRAEINVGRSVGEAPVAEAQRFRIEVISLGLEILERVLSQGEASDASLARVENLLVEEQAAPHLLCFLRGERALTDERMKEYQRGNYLGMPPGQEPPRWLLPSLPSIWKKHRALTLSYYNAAIAIARTSPETRLPAINELSKISIRENPFDDSPSIMPLAQNLYSSALAMTPGTAGTDHRLIATLRSAVAVIACERHRLKHGAWPASIATIDVSFFPKNLADPYTGTPLKFEPRDGGLVIYAVGPDTVDNHAYFIRRNYDRVNHDVGFRIQDPQGRHMKVSAP